MRPALTCRDPLAYGRIHAENLAMKLDISSSLPLTGSLEIGSTQSSKPSSLASIALICPTFFAFFFSSPPKGQAVSLVPSKVTDRAGRS